MVTLPKELLEDPTIAAMRLAIEAKQETKRRNYLGASLIGDPCPRKVWYDYNGYNKEPIPSQGLMAIEDGHRTEDLTAYRLRLVDGVDLVTHNADGSQVCFSDLGGKFKGHIDGLIFGIKQAPKTWHIWENKSCKHEKFNEFKRVKKKFGEKDALKNWNITYYVQHQLYMHYFECTRGYLTVSYSGGRDYATCRTNYKKDIALQYIDRANKIVNASLAPTKVSEQSDYYLCRFCPFSNECHS